MEKVCRKSDYALGWEIKSKFRTGREGESAAAAFKKEATGRGGEEEEQLYHWHKDGGWAEGYGQPWLPLPAGSFTHTNHSDGQLRGMANHEGTHYGDCGNWLLMWAGQTIKTILLCGETGPYLLSNTWFFLGPKIISQRENLTLCHITAFLMWQFCLFSLKSNSHFWLHFFITIYM